MSSFASCIQLVAQTPSQSSEAVLPSHLRQPVGPLLSQRLLPMSGNLRLSLWGVDALGSNFLPRTVSHTRGVLESGGGEAAEF